MSVRPIGRILEVVLFAFALMLAGANIVAASFSRTYTIDDLPAAELKEPIRELFHKFNPGREDELLEKTKTVYDIYNHFSILILQPDINCSPSRCRTVIARNDDGKLVPELLIDAGNIVRVESFYATDYYFRFEGSHGSALTIKRIGQLWSISACGRCRYWGGEGKLDPSERWQPPPPPKMPPPPEKTFEEFRREFDLLR